MELLDASSTPYIFHGVTSTPYRLLGVTSTPMDSL
ncbi:hypothetical protein T06_9589, partial [Trichinella sp. T6]